jgi:hypothetical protein
MRKERAVRWRARGSWWAVVVVVVGALLHPSLSQLTTQPLRYLKIRLLSKYKYKVFSIPG